MPRNQFQRSIFALITVIFTVHLFVFYNLYFIPTVELGAPYQGALVFGRFAPIWAVILLEFISAYILEVFMGSPISFKLASRVFDIKTTHSQIFESAVICATVGIMCPAMSFLAAIYYYDYSVAFNLWHFLAVYLCTVIRNFPLALLSQLFFIQPLVRTIFRFLFKNSIKSQAGKETAKVN